MFESAISKLQRGNHHYVDLAERFKAFVADNPQRLMVETDESFLQAQFVKDIPPEFSLIIGDAIHNFRAALDHMTWDIIGRTGGKQHKTLAFPISDTSAKFFESCRCLPTKATWVRDLFKLFEAFPEGSGHVFHTLHTLDIADKHRAIRPVLEATAPPPYRVVYPDGSFSDYADNLFVGFRGRFPIGKLPKGSTIKMDENASCSIAIIIPDIGVGGRLAFHALADFQKSVATAISVARQETLRRLES